MTTVLNGKIPEPALAYANELLNESGCTFTISKHRNSKYGDFRHGVKLGRPKITVNGNLNVYSFLITLIHELAHAYAYKRYGKRIQPHGKEWKSTFQLLMDPMLNGSIFPSELEKILQAHMKNPRATTGADMNLLKALRMYDDNQDLVYLEELSIGTVFKLKNGRTFLKGSKRRKNFLCLELSSKKKYTISPLAEVKPLMS